MDIRKDLKSVESEIFRLLAIGDQFRSFDQDWSHLKNKEDFKLVSRIPYDEQNKVENLYAVGRDMAIYMYSSLLEINYDFCKYPTLTAIIESFQESWVYGHYDTKTPDIAKDTCTKHSVSLWSVDKMANLFRNQEKLLNAVRITLKTLENSNLYKTENSMPVMNQEANISVSGVSGSSINIHSSGATASVVNNADGHKIFADMISQVQSSELDHKTQSNLIDNVKELEAGHKRGEFKDAYKDFMQNISAHITVFTPFIPILTSLL